MLISQIVPEDSPFHIATKRAGSGLGGGKGDDWLFQKDNAGGKNGPSMSDMHQDVG